MCYRSSLHVDQRFLCDLSEAMRALPPALKNVVRDAPICTGDAIENVIKRISAPSELQNSRKIRYGARLGRSSLFRPGRHTLLRVTDRKNRATSTASVGRAGGLPNAPKKG